MFAYLENLSILFQPLRISSNESIYSCIYSKILCQDSLLLWISFCLHGVMQMWKLLFCSNMGSWLSHDQEGIPQSWPRLIRHPPIIWVVFIDMVQLKKPYYLFSYSLSLTVSWVVDDAGWHWPWRSKWCEDNDNQWGLWRSKIKLGRMGAKSPKYWISSPLEMGLNWMILLHLLQRCREF